MQSAGAGARHVYVVGTVDTKGAELRYLRDLVAAQGVSVRLVDVGLGEPGAAVDIAAAQVAASHPLGAGAVLGESDRGRAVAAMGEAFARFIILRDDLAGVLGLGGGGGTSILTAGTRVLPVGVPKLVVSTLASGETSAFVGSSDLTLVHSVTDFAGLNRISRAVLGNAAHAMVGMVRHGVPAGPDRPAIGLTMFGVTTTCVTRVVESLRADYDCLVFHATGTGGRTMEKLADSGLLEALVDVTTTEVCDLLVGGVLSAGEDRLGSLARRELPWVGSAGALDMVNFWGYDTVPAAFRGRLLHRHNPQVTLMRTTPPECVLIGRWIGERLNAARGPVRFLIPERGVSALDAPGQPFHDPIADAALFTALEDTVRQSPQRRVLRLPLHINDPAFAQALVESLREITPGAGRQPGPTSAGDCAT